MTTDNTELRQPQSKTELFIAFTLMALQGIGGVLVIVQYELVERRRWLSKAQFLEEWSVAQIMPGPNVVNLARTTPATHMLVVRHRDRPGVLAEITAAMRDADVSIESLIQQGRHDAENPGAGEVLVAMVTHEGPEAAVSEALRLLQAGRYGEAVQSAELALLARRPVGGVAPPAVSSLPMSMPAVK